ncbi:putative thiazole-containing bacteriocin maturation protein [Halobacillus massiliensis]|uniref:putative thiazole-containing bacteriocin maturation protein n=1 Tax=Halobacillus massiliensis TaxID=1926286 RepID=UPI0009E3EFD8|nr:putative thiazole-containing bacteriocin maturation protein [Halobacillus massiliensis]
MSNVKHSMCLKVKRGTFFMPEPSGSVYFRNSSGSFRMEGSTVFQWVEKLMPMFTGENSLASLTDGLPQPYKDRIYAISDALYTNGFLRDVSGDLPHTLPESVLEKFASQIEYLESFGDSAAFRFQKYREIKTLAIGEGSMLIGLVSALISSGAASIHALTAEDCIPRLRELKASAKKMDAEVIISSSPIENGGSWHEVIEDFDVVFYVSQEGNVKELRNILEVCKEKEKIFNSALCIGERGLAGPLVSPDSNNCWESAWRSIHNDVMKSPHQSSSYSSPAGSMLANILVFEAFKKITGVSEAHTNNHLYLLNLKTLEGKWHPFKNHPLVSGQITVKRVKNLNTIESEIKNEGQFFYYFSQLTSRQTGIFHHWEEGELSQLPLSQCEVQVIDVLSNKLHRPLVIGAMTHEEARREAGLRGIEQYVLPLKNKLSDSLDGEIASLQLGAGETFLEAAARALQKSIEARWHLKSQEWNGHVTKIEFNRVEDHVCRYYLQALETMKILPEISLGYNSGFPVVWMKDLNSQWYGKVGFTLTLALREALLTLLKQAQNSTSPDHESPLEFVFQDKEVETIDIPAYETNDLSESLQTALRILHQNSQTATFFKISLEPFEEDGVVSICGVDIKEEETT